MFLCRFFFAAGVLATLAPGSRASGQDATIIERTAKAFTIDSIARRPDVTITAPSVLQVQRFVANPFGADRVPTSGELNTALLDVRKAVDPGSLSASGTSLEGSAAGASIPLPGLPSQAELIVGVTNFMVRRAQDELVFSFVDHLKTTVHGNAVVQALMPSSYEILQSVDPASFQLLVPQLRTAAEEELRSLPVQVGNKPVLDALNVNATQRSSLQLASITFRRIREMRGGTHPAASLANLRDLDVSSLDDHRLRTPLVLIGLVSREYAADAYSTRDVLHVEDRRRVFARFLADDLVSRLGVVSEERVKILAMVRARQTDLQQLVDELNQIDTRVRQAQSVRDEVERELASAGAVEGALVLLSNSRRYLPPEWADNSALTFAESARRLNRAWVERDYPAILAWLTSYVHTSSLDAGARATALRYLSFAASVASAHNAEQVTAALRTAAGPVGTYRLKRQADPKLERPVGLYITGYVGATGGYEHAASDTAGRGGGGGHLGPAIPVGFEASWPKKWGSFSLFLPVIDVGTLASLRIGDSSVETGAEVGFQQVIAPGLFAVWGLGTKSPAVFGIGIQSAPDLRKPADGGAPLSVWRASAIFGVDVTLLRL